MPRDSIELDPRVIIALDVYQPARREEILAELYELVENQTNRQPAKGCPVSERLYIAETPAGLLVIYRTDEEGRVVELVDYFRPWRDDPDPVPATSTSRPASGR